MSTVDMARSGKQKNNTKYQPTREEIDTRRAKLADIMDEFKSKGQRLENKQLIKAMKQAGYKGYTKYDLYHDDKALAQANTFIRDLTEAKASKFYEDLYSRLDRYLQDADKMYNKLLERFEKGDNVAKEMRAIGYYVNHLTEQCDNMMKGPMMNISNTLASAKIKRLAETNEHLKNLLIKHGVDVESGKKIAKAEDYKLQET